MANIIARAHEFRVYDSASRERYTLDLRGCTVVHQMTHVPGTNLIPLQLGRHSCAFDIIEEELPADTVAAIRSIVMLRERKNGWSEKLLARFSLCPIGIDVEHLPPGAAIVRGYLS